MQERKTENISDFLREEKKIEQTLHTDSFSSSLRLVGKFAGELGVRRLVNNNSNKINGLPERKRRLQTKK
jgi:hypothetical protein